MQDADDQDDGHGSSSTWASAFSSARRDACATAAGRDFLPKARALVMELNASSRRVELVNPQVHRRVMLFTRRQISLSPAAQAFYKVVPRRTADAAC